MEIEMKMELEMELELELDLNLEVGDMLCWVNIRRRRRSERLTMPDVYRAPGRTRCGAKGFIMVFVAQTLGRQAGRARTETLERVFGSPPASKSPLRAVIYRVSGYKARLPCCDNNAERERGRGRQQSIKKAANRFRIGEKFLGSVAIHGVIKQF